MPYHKRAYKAPAAAEDDVAAALWEAGTVGVEVVADGAGWVRLEAYFSAGGPSAEPALPAGAERLADAAVLDADWLAPYRARAVPFALGRRFFVDPREPGATPAPAPPDGRSLLRLPARGAFGVGSHESTRLAVELLEDAADERQAGDFRVLDLGTGTGILAFAALRLGARSAVAFDADPVAAIHARQNGDLNRLTPRLYAGRVSSLAPSARFDLALVNALPEEVAADLPAVVALLSPGGELVLSGLLAERAPEVLARLAALELVERGRRAAGEWLGLRLRRRPALGGSER
jgi:ribosomal protein L11 methyltransferase